MVRVIDYGFVTQLQGKFMTLWGDTHVAFGWSRRVVITKKGVNSSKGGGSQLPPFLLVFQVTF